MGQTIIQFPRPRTIDLKVVTALLNHAPGDPVQLSGAENSVTVYPNPRRTSASPGATFTFSLYSTMIRIILHAAASLLTLLAGRDPEADRLRVRAARQLGAIAALEERAHDTGEVSGHLNAFSTGRKAIRTSPHRGVRRSASAEHRFGLMLSVC
ncbi:hypothetical protein [Streptomyces sp. NPDC058583]|uniref:hypothetical protein n=1 Tax=unclassified Streptomyces TaxID=2593676 RepID=UPI003662563B